MSEITPESDVSSSYPNPTREGLISLLVRASEIEHSLACTCFFIAYSLKNDVSEGGLTDEQAGMVRRWRRSLLSAATTRMLHLAQISNLLTAIGGALHMTRPIFSASVSTNSIGTGFVLEPFSQATIDRLVTYEQQDVAIVRLDTAVNASTNGHATYITIKDLYDRIAQAFHNLPAEELFIGSAKGQIHPPFIAKDGPLVVVDQDSAITAIRTIVGTESETVPADPDVQLQISKTISKEYGSALEAAQQAGLPFEPVRPVVRMPSMNLYEKQAGYTGLVDPLTRKVANLFNDAYDTLLFLLSWVFTHAEEADTDLEKLARISLRLIHAVIRPLGETLTFMPVDSTSLQGLSAGAPFSDRGNDNLSDSVQQSSMWELLDERLWQLATAATTLYATTELPTAFWEATATLQDLACLFAPADGSRSSSAKEATLKQIQAELGCVVQSSVNGPYLVTNVDVFKNWLGENIPTRPQMALCRCGGSSIKPFCDGTHALIDFTSQKDPKRVPDHRDTYAGTAITVFDNRGICAHSGFCTDRLSSVFHAGQETFVTPSGARMDDIMRAVRSCPSGALSYAIGGIEARDQVDQTRPLAIEVSKDGPYRITGSIVLKDGQGKDEIRNTGSSREHYSLCRCGHSQNKPFCSGMHWYVNFHDPEFAKDHEFSLFEWAGGLPALNRVTRLFYDKYVPQEPLLQPLFANMSPDHPERVAAWLGEVFGGPKNYSGNYGGYSRMLSQHIGKGISETMRARWVTLLCQSSDEAGLPADPEFRSAFASYIEWGSRLAVENSTSGAHPPLHMPMPRWNWGTAGTPQSRVSALAPITQEEEVALPTANETVHFKQHIKPLFRSMDRESMKWIFDLWSYTDVTKYADSILQRLQKGSMPCDGAWSQEKVAIFQRWIASGMQE
jgi:CDGSH-type Zn-finger protein/truncated hemoglobin YjbI